MSQQNRQRFIVDLPASTARSALLFLSKGSGYADLSELVAVALENQLRLEEAGAEPIDSSVHLSQEVHRSSAALPRQTIDKGPSRTEVDGVHASRRDHQANPESSSGTRGRSNSSRVAAKPSNRKATRTITPASSRNTRQKPAAVAADPPRPTRASRNATKPATRALEADAGSLSTLDTSALLRLPDPARVELGSEVVPPEGASLTPFTNRMNPLVIPLRVLANATAMVERVAINDFIRIVPSLAREVGLRLKREDDAHARRGRLRRWTAWPVGEDEEASLARFRNSFLFKTDTHGEATGPLVDLGLVDVSDRLLLTRRGLDIALEKTPLLGEIGDGGVLSDRQCDLFREALLSLPGERWELQLFLEALQKSGGEQVGIDELIHQAHSTWTEAQVIAHRAAMIGRLRDVGVIDVVPGGSGDGTLAMVESHSKDFREALGVASV